MKKALFTLIILLIILYILLNNILNINYIKKQKSNLEIIGNNYLELKKNYNSFNIPHINIKGIITELTKDSVDIKLSKKSKVFLKDENIKIKNNIDLKINDKIFIMLEDIKIEKNKLFFSTIRIYKLLDNIERINEKPASIICSKSGGGFIKIQGKSFKYNNIEYFFADADLSENNEMYYEDVESKLLLYEPYKHILYPKIFNMINSQETKFNEIINFYK